ncbi:hypothetical protein SLS57_008207 [Botryosphaeria dothidea]
MAASSSVPAEDRRWIVLTMVCLVLALGLPSLLLRAYVKLQVRKLITADDWIMLLAALLWIGYIVCQVAACANGLGGHRTDLPKDSYYYLVGTAHNGDVVEALRVSLFVTVHVSARLTCSQFWYVCTLLHVLAAAAIRLSVGVSIALVATSAARRWIIIIDLAVSTSTSIAFLFLLAFQCSPAPAFWARNRADAQRSCHTPTTTTFWFAFAALSAFADAILGSFTLPTLLDRHSTWRKRSAVAALAFFAAAALATSALQIAQVPSLADVADLTFAAADFACFALLAPSLGLVAANLATLGPWIKELGWDMSTQAPARTARVRGGRSQVNVMRGRGEDVEAVLDAAVLEGLGRLEGGAD